MRVLLIGFFILTVQAVSCHAQPESGGTDIAPDLETLLSVHERFVYNVRYGFLNLGEIEVELLPDTTYQGKRVLHMRTVMRSNSSIPFVGRRNVHYQNFFDYSDDKLYSYIFWRDDLHDEEYERYKIVFDREEHLVFFFERGEAQDTLDLIEPASGGDVVFFYSRMFAGLEEPYELPVYIAGERGLVTAFSSSETETRSYDAFPRPVETYKSEGTADIDGPFGFTGRFRSWFTADELRLPVEAHVRVVFGNVKVRLISYEQIEERTTNNISETESR
ncbi:MAG: DUF3108 domain-containing protein [Balneolaceae bacterium]